MVNFKEKEEMICYYNQFVEKNKLYREKLKLQQFREKEEIIQLYNQFIDENRLFLTLSNEKKFQNPSTKYILNYHVTNIKLEKVDIYYDKHLETFANISNYPLLDNLKSKINKYPVNLDVFNYLILEFSHNVIAHQYVMKIPVLNIHLLKMIKDNEIQNLIKTIFFPIRREYFARPHNGSKYFDSELHEAGWVFRRLTKENNFDNPFTYKGFISHIKHETTKH